MKSKTDTPHTSASRRKPISIRLKLLLAVNAVLISATAVLLLIDYQQGLSERMRNKQVALSEEADVLLPAIDALRHHGTIDVQAYIDRACARMRDATSPGHHIAVELGSESLQARTHSRDSPAFIEAMRRGAGSADHQAIVQGQPIIVGSRSEGETRVYVSEFTTNVRGAARSRLFARAGGISLIGLAAVGVVNFVLLRLVTHPINRLVSMVRRIGKGQFGESMERFGSAELDYLSTEIVTMSDSLAEADRHRRQQMAKARSIQQNLLPRPEQLKSAGIHLTHRPAEDVGGDYFDVKTVGDHCLVVCIGDVVGHGVPAAMSAGMLKTLFTHGSSQPCDPSVVLSEINRRFNAVTLEGDFATMLLAVIDRQEGRLTYASAGHEAGYLVRADREICELSTTGMLLGIDPEAQCDSVTVEINPGDTIVLLTDGLVETLSPSGKLLGREALREVLRDRHSNGSAHHVAEALLRRAAEHRCDQPQYDDITVAVVRV
jgi:phosphoserine phosphatase RsbU/P